MKLKNITSQSDPHVSFLDISLCLLVVFVLLFAVALMQAKKNFDDEKKQAINSVSKKIQKEKDDLIKKIQEQKQKISHVKEELKLSKLSNRYRGRGGQAHIPIEVYFDDDFYFKIGSYSYSWRQFRKMICNLDRKEENGKSSLIFHMKYQKSYKELAFDEFFAYFKDKVSVDSITKTFAKENFFDVFCLLKKTDIDFEMSCRKFKIKNTTSYVGNWDGDKIEEREWIKYEERKEFGNPFLWFTVDNENKSIILGPQENPLVLSSKEFVDLIGSVKGGDGFYVEYRDPKTLKYNPLNPIPDWVKREVFDVAGFSSFIN